MNESMIVVYKAVTYIVFKPGTCWPQAGVRLVPTNYFYAVEYVCVIMCVCPPRGHK